MLDGRSVEISSLRDLERLEAVPFETRVDARSTFALIQEGAAKNPDGVAIYALKTGEIDEAPVEITFSALLSKVTQTANAFFILGLRAHDVVSSLLPSVPEAHFVMWGGETAGIVNPINPHLERAHILELLNAAGSKIVVAPSPTLDPETWSKLRDLAAHVPTLQAILTVGGEPPAGALSFERAIAAQPSDRLLSDRRIQPEDIAAYFHTGGTTGVPKLAAQTQWNQIYQAWALCLHCDIRPGDCLLVGLPLFHNSAVINMGLAPLSNGASIVLLTPSGYRTKAVISNFWRLVERYRATFFIAVPTVYSSLLNVSLAGADVSSLRFGLSGAAPAPPEVIEKTERNTGIVILEAYGLTEATCGAACNPRNGAKKRGSIGQRFAYEEMKVVELAPEGVILRECEVDEIGTLVIRGPGVFAGYLDKSHNAKAFVGPGWLNTGDLARQDADGYFWITGRSKDVIIRGGHNIEPGMIEDALHKHPAVGAAAAVGRPDSYAGELPVVYVALRPDASASPEELKEFARHTVPERAAVPVEVYIVDTIPQTAVGKIFKPPLRRDATRRAFELLLTDLGIAHEIAVADDEKHGLMTTIRVIGTRQAGLLELIVSKLSGLSQKYQIVWQGEPEAHDQPHQ